jgi:hypothetical protein
VADHGYNRATISARTVQFAPSLLPALCSKFLQTPAVNQPSRVHFVAGAVVIDPHILHSSQQIGMLEGFLRVLKIVPEIAVKIKASRVRGDERISPVGRSRKRPNTSCGGMNGGAISPVRLRCRLPPTVSRGMVRSRASEWNVNWKA